MGELDKLYDYGGIPRSRIKEIEEDAECIKARQRERDRIKDYAYKLCEDFKEAEDKKAKEFEELDRDVDVDKALDILEDINKFKGAKLGVLNLWRSLKSNDLESS